MSLHLFTQETTCSVFMYCHITSVVSQSELHLWGFVNSISEVLWTPFVRFCEHHMWGFVNSICEVLWFPFVRFCELHLWVFVNSICELCELHLWGFVISICEVLWTPFMRFCKLHLWGFLNSIYEVFEHHLWGMNSGLSYVLFLSLSAKSFLALCLYITALVLLLIHNTCNLISLFHELAIICTYFFPHQLHTISAISMTAWLNLFFSEIVP